MKEFNKTQELLKLRIKQNKNTYIKRISIILSCVILVIGIIMFTFAKFESNKSYTLIQGKLGDYSSGDINIAFNVDGNSSNTMPEKGTGYKYKRAECNDSNVEVTFNKTTWEANVQHVTKKTKCTLYFETVTEVEVTLYGGVNEVITVDNEDTYTMDSTGKLENVTLSVDEHELKGSISNQTFTVDVDSEDTKVYAMPNNGNGVIYWYGNLFEELVESTASWTYANHTQGYTLNTNSILLSCSTATSSAYYSSGIATKNLIEKGDKSKIVFLSNNSTDPIIFEWLDSYQSSAYIYALTYDHYNKVGQHHWGITDNHNLVNNPNTYNNYKYTIINNQSRQDIIYAIYLE